MATKPLLPEVVAERAKAANDYRNAHQAAIDRIEKLRSARMQRDAELHAVQTSSTPSKKANAKRASRAGDKRAKISNSPANAHTDA